MHRGGEGGFTLIEMLVVITILLVLTGISLGMYSYLDTAARLRTTDGRVHLLGTKVVEALKLKGSCPASLADLVPALGHSSWLEGGRFLDGWDRPIQYSVNGTSFKIWSPGPDGVLGTADDIEFAR
jgi:general secretion pathway protein G